MRINVWAVNWRIYDKYQTSKSCHIYSSIAWKSWSSTAILFAEVKTSLQWKIIIFSDTILLEFVV